MANWFTKKTVPTVPEKQYTALQERYDKLETKWQTERDTVRRLTEEKTNVQQINSALAQEVATLKDAQQAQIDACIQLSAENDILRAIVQEAALHLAQVKVGRSATKEWGEKRAGIISRIHDLGINVYEVVAEKPKEAKEATGGNH